MNNLTPHGIKAIEKVIQWLDAGAQHVDASTGRVIDKFNMSHAVSKQTCGTSCCIAGAVVQFEGLDTFPLSENAPDVAAFYDQGDSKGVASVVTEYLGLDEESANRLFLPWGERHNDEWLPEMVFSVPANASAVLNRLLVTGEVVWFLPESEDE